MSKKSKNREDSARGGHEDVQIGGKKKGQKGCNTGTSQEVTHPSTTPAQARLTAEFWWDPVL